MKSDRTEGERIYLEDVCKHRRVYYKREIFIGRSTEDATGVQHQRAIHSRRDSRENVWSQEVTASYIGSMRVRLFLFKKPTGNGTRVRPVVSEEEISPRASIANFLQTK